VYAIKEHVNAYKVFIRCIQSLDQTTAWTVGFLHMQYVLQLGAFTVYEDPIVKVKHVFSCC